ncbi:ATP-binding cassette domain-containing protein [Thalassobius vesicularis]|uniref:ATP-binding cassette domain-containing protein n=1 Tax=Thalassobius vesicularis TaxID=1294297 RepID=A0A4S3M8L7_9RHOB|nr:ATP-binding cassette domain-containing protein [Thalassobius vesicularis]THD73792.1 ATP-binding cassette domain-containing protein [Thalassobius vesicularis]
MLTLEGLVIRQDGFELSADLHVPDGARVAVIGPSGAGKSTLLNAVAGFQPVDEGRIRMQGRDVTGLAPGKRPVSMLFQDNNLFPHLSAAQNVGLGLRPDLRLDAAQRARVAQALERVGLQGLEGRKPGQLSGGQASRVALARVLVQGRGLVLLDEPFAALGPALKAEMLDLLEEVLDETGATLLLVTHDPADALRIAPQTILVADGWANAPVATAQLFADPPLALRSYLGVPKS